MKFRFIEKPGKDPDYTEWDLFITDNDGITSRSGHLTLTREEFETLKFVVLDGEQRFMEKEVTFEFEQRSSVPAYTEGAPNLGEAIETLKKAGDDLVKAAGRALEQQYPWGYRSDQEEP